MSWNKDRCRWKAGIADSAGAGIGEGAGSIADSTGAGIGEGAGIADSTGAGISEVSYVAITKTDAE